MDNLCRAYTLNPTPANLRKVVEYVYDNTSFERPVEPTKERMAALKDERRLLHGEIDHYEKMLGQAKERLHEVQEEIQEEDEAMQACVDADLHASQFAFACADKRARDRMLPHARKALQHHYHERGELADTATVILSPSCSPSRSPTPPPSLTTSTRPTLENAPTETPPPLRLIHTPATLKRQSSFSCSPPNKRTRN